MNAPDRVVDPILAALLDAHKAREVYPTGHVVRMTREVDDKSRALSVATCECGAVIRLLATKYLEMDAAIEAHWQKFDHAEDRGQPVDKVDGRGRPIVPGWACIKGEICRCQIVDQEHSFADAVAKRERCGNWREDSSGGKHVNEKRALQTQAEAAADAARIEARGDEPQHQVVTQALEDSASREGKQADRPDAGQPSAATKDEKIITENIPSRADSEAPQAATTLHDANKHDVASTELAAPADEADDIAIEWPSYDRFVEDKIVTVPFDGFEIDPREINPMLKPHQRDIVVWALRGGRRAIFAAFGLGKTFMQLEILRLIRKYQSDKPVLNVLPLGVRTDFFADAQALNIPLRFVNRGSEVDLDAILISNYEPVRDGKLDPKVFGAASLDEADCLRSYGSETFQTFLPLFRDVPLRFVATATPSPNRYKELIHYAAYLGIMDSGQALTRFFQRNSEKAGDLTLYPHKVDEFWLWVHSWAIFIQRPSDLGYSDEGYELPPVKVFWHEVPSDHSTAKPERDGQGALFRNTAMGLAQAAAEKRDSMPARLDKAKEVIDAAPDDHWLIWHSLEAERHAIEKMLPDVVTIWGSQKMDAREQRVIDFAYGKVKRFATKPELSGVGCNFQRFCHKEVFTGVSFKFRDFIQAYHRIVRFLQEHECEVHIIHSEAERDVVAVLKQKWAQHDEMVTRMSEIIRTYGLDKLPMRDVLARSIGVKRVEIKSEKFIAINNDAVAECKAWPDQSIDQIITSVPFANHYEYSPNYSDFGHTDDNAHFWRQMDFLSAELHRMLKPGRLACIHVKDRILFGAVTGEGVPTISPFHAEAIMHYRAHSFQYMGMITVVTDVVRENNQAYRLGWSENCKDGTKMGVGSPEYVLLMRKPQSDRTRGYADAPVVKQKKEQDGADGYSRARWQIDAHAFWRSSGNRLLTPQEFAECSSADLAKLFAKTSVDRVYDYEAHVKIGEKLERIGTLPATFMSIAPGSHHPDVWHDIARMRTLNMLQERRGAEMHLCPLQFDIVDRLIERYSNEGELIFDPFGGIGSVPYRAILKGRRGAMTELSGQYFLDAVHYLHTAEEKVTTPQLFDLASFDAAATPPPPLAELTETEA